MTLQKIRIYRHPNRDIVSFLLNEDISNFGIGLFKSPFDPNCKGALKPLGNIGSQVVKETMEIPGIRELQIKPHELIVKKETSASWENIEKIINEILIRALRRRMIRVVK